jgi:hypothetical protein
MGMGMMESLLVRDLMDRGVVFERLTTPGRAYR